MLVFSKSSFCIGQQHGASVPFASAHTYKVFFWECNLKLKVFLFFSPAMLAAKRQDGGLFKSPPYPGYPFIMIPDLTSPYLPNGSLSPTARTVSVFNVFLQPHARS